MPKLSVILTHQLDVNRKYLEFALRGLREQTFKDFETLLVSGAESAPPVSAEPCRVHWDRSLDVVTKKIHWAIKNSDSDFILLHSDDVVLSRESLGEMISASLPAACIMNPFSNSDCRSLYSADFGLVRGPEHLTLVHDMSYEDVEGWNEEILDFPLGRRILMPVKAVSFYCTMIPRRVWEAVGDLDQALEYRHNDEDFCMRAAQIGVPSVVNLAPFAFHFGSRTLSHMADNAVRDAATEHFRKKWGFHSVNVRP